jgi:hypothetical protein
MAILAKKTGGGHDLGPLPPPGIHQAICVDAIDLGLLDKTFSGVTTKQHTALVIWQLVDENTGKRYLAGKRYNVTLNEKSNLRKDLVAWRGSPPTAAEEQHGFDVEKFIGARCTLIITHAIKPDRTYANVDKVMPRDKKKPKVEKVGYTRAAVEQPEEESDFDAEDTPVAETPLATSQAVPPVPVTDDDIPF